MADDSDSSALSSAPEEELQKLAPIFIKAKKATKAAAPPPKASPQRPRRPPSPPHEDVLADKQDIAFIVMFRSRFQAAFPSKLGHLGPQDIERGIVDSRPSPQVEAFLCAVLGLVLNRKKPVEQGHYGRALEEAMLSQKPQWPSNWNGQNPVHAGKDFNNMTPEERLTLLRTLIIWSLSSSDAISTIIKDSYKQSRHNDDENQPLSVQPWGRDGDKRRYFLVEGQDDTSFRIYREGDRFVKDHDKYQWYSMAGDIEEVRVLAERLEKNDGSQAARTLSQRMLNAIPRFEATEEVWQKKRRRREYRQTRRAAFTRPEPGFSLYEGRTRGKRMRYTFDDDDEAFLSDDTSTRRSARQSARTTPFEPAGPTYTASGRQVKPRHGGEYGTSLLSGQATSTDDLALDADGGIEDTEDSEPPVRNGRGARIGSRGNTNGGGVPQKRKHIDGYNSIDELSDEDDAAPSGDEWNSDGNDDEDDEMPDADDEEEDAGEGDDEDDLDDVDAAKSLLVTLKVSKNEKKGDVASVEALGAPGSPESPKHEASNGAILASAGNSNGSVQVDAVKSEALPGVPNGSSHVDSQSSSTSLQPPNADQVLSGYPTPNSVATTNATQKVELPSTA